MKADEASLERDDAEAAAMWVKKLATEDAEVRRQFVDWVCGSSRRLRLFLEMTVTEQQVGRVVRSGLVDAEAMLKEDERNGSRRPAFKAG